MSNQQLPSPELLHKVLRYNKTTGLFYWLDRKPDTFLEVGIIKSQKFCDGWNRRYAGKRAFTSSRVNGYLQTTLLCRSILAQRTAWAMAHLTYPSLNIDHINHDRSDNRLTNLRLVSRSDNLKNSSLSKANTSGYTGVSWNKNAGKWVAQIRDINQKYKYLGLYDDKEQAYLARKEAEKENGYHQNHGKAL